jgi:glycine cleavage system transcriptional repressor
MQNLLVLSAIGQDRAGIVQAISQSITECGCNITDSRMTVLGGEFAVIMLLGGSWDAIVKLENSLSRLEKKLELIITSKRTENRMMTKNQLSYMVEVVAMDHPGIVHDIAKFMSSYQINIEDVATSSYAAPHTGTQMFSMTMTISIPSELSISKLRNEFMDMCDDLNLDAVMGPFK